MREGASVLIGRAEWGAGDLTFPAWWETDLLTSVMGDQWGELSSGAVCWGSQGKEAAFLSRGGWSWLVGGVDNYTGVWRQEATPTHRNTNTYNGRAKTTDMSHNSMTVFIYCIYNVWIIYLYMRRHLISISDYNYVHRLYPLIYYTSFISLMFTLFYLTLLFSFLYDRKGDLTPLPFQPLLRPLSASWRLPA